MNWLDRLARRTAQTRATAPAPTQRDANRATAATPDKTRRDFLKKAGIVGGLAWTAPVLQSVIVPAAAASGGSILGQPCTAPSTCADGSVCSAVTGICGGPGATCSGNVPCLYDNCFQKVCGSPGAKCSTNSACTQGNCSPGNPAGNNRRCGGPGAVCATKSDCEHNLDCEHGHCSK